MTDISLGEILSMLLGLWLAQVPIYPILLTGGFGDWQLITSPKKWKRYNPR